VRAASGRGKSRETGRRHDKGRHKRVPDGAGPPREKPDIGFRV
jgi:hypothetical protein